MRDTLAVQVGKAGEDLTTSDAIIMIIMIVMIVIVSAAHDCQPARCKGW